MAHHKHPQYPRFPHLHGHDDDQGHKDHDLTNRLRTQALPDLRFETSYLKSIRRYVQVSEEEQEWDGKMEPLRRDVQVQVEWGKVLWVTIRDQVLSPFVQGAVWGYASLFIRPIFASLRSRTGLDQKPKKAEEGRAAGWLRNWFRASLGGVTASLAGAR
ncbi:hypothetical protein OE88DRAFT_458911 [Heliocybe sulcata]|uniref:Uncharacterized protein n=1 Tax=Heliocybe sulcata TaxID=5364 RepID=A0A5C3MVP3_9AGAM|nr:hypothetical protein OE88DRAFT_458911 [Heliocybe sulcata]